VGWRLCAAGRAQSPPLLVPFLTAPPMASSCSQSQRCIHFGHCRFMISFRRGVPSCIKFVRGWSLQETRLLLVGALR
jgi:hypothetical protein